MPVFLAGRKPDHITGSDFLDSPAFALSPAAASRNDESLSEGMRVPCSPRTRLERHARTLNKRRIGCLKKLIDSYGASDDSDGPVAEGCEPTLLISISLLPSLHA